MITFLREKSIVPLFFLTNRTLCNHTRPQTYTYIDMQKRIYINASTYVRRCNTTAFNINSKQINTATLKPNTALINKICIQSPQSSFINCDSTANVCPYQCAYL